MAVKSFAKSAPATKAVPARSGNGRSVQRKVLPGLFSPSIIQRKESSGSWVHRSSQKPVGSRSMVQPKAKVHAANDHYEKEADHIADKVMSRDTISSPLKVSRVSSGGAQRKCASCEKEDAVQAMHVQRKCSSCGDKEPVQTKQNKSTSSNTFHSSDSGPPQTQQHNTTHKLDSVLDNQSARGSPLPHETRAFMENRMGADLSKVRIHTDQNSHEANTSIGAKAFTSGGNIHFAQGEFNPQTRGGKQLLAHELAHTMQQGAAPEKVPSKPGGSVKGLRKVVPKEKHEKKIARLSSEFDNKDASRKKAGNEFSGKFKNKKAPKLSAAALKKGKKKKSGKDPPALPGKEKKKQNKPAKPAAKSNHLQAAKAQQSGLGQLASGGINFKPNADKAVEEDPAQKKQSLQSKKIGDGVLSKAASSATHIHSSITRIRPRLMQSAGKAISRIKTNETQQKEKIKTTIKEQKLSVKKSMQSAAGSISGYHKKVTGELKVAAIKARAEILVAKILNTVFIEVAAILQKPKIDKAYEDAKKDYTAKGRSVGSECYSSQSQRSWNNFISKMKYEDDSFLDGPYTDDMKQARGDAAIKIGEGYQESMTNAGVEQAAGIDAGKPNDLKRVDDSKVEMLKGVNSMYDDSLKAINAGETAGISQADSTKKSMLGNVYKQHKTAQAQLDTTEKTQLQLAEILSLKQSQQVELQASQAIESMEEGGYQSLMHLHNGFKEYKQVCESMNSPPPALLQQKLQPIQASLETSPVAMAASLQKGMMQTENGFNKTATDTITTTNTTVAQTLAESKITNDKAIDGLNKLRSAAVTALQGILNNNKKTITETASTCVTNIQNIKTAFDGSLTSIQGDLDSGLKAGSLEFKGALQKAVSSGTADNGNKSMLDYSIEQENEAADKCEPRWKSVVKVLIVIAVILVVALVVGPAVIGFIGAAAGGGAFGTAVGAVVGGAILGAGSSAVITVSNNLLDGKKWDTGLKEAMIEGAVTGAIGGAFGAAGSGIAGKLIGVAAKGVAPALGRFAISQAVDFAGNVVTEYASSKLQGKEFSWKAVAQGQAIGAGMHVSMGGLSSLKNVKGFKTINAITEGAGNLGDKFGKKITGRPTVVEPHVAAPKTGVEEPHNRGPTAPKDEPGIAPKTGDEPVKTAPKDEPVAPAAKTGDEQVKTASKEDPHNTGKPAEEPHGGTKPVEEPKATAPKEDVKTTGPDEPVTPGGKKKSELPSNLTPEDVELGVVGKAPTDDGHNIKVTEDGHIIKCSTCVKLEQKYSAELKDPKVQAEFDKIKAMPDGEAKAREARNFDRRMENRLVREYQAANPGTKKPELEIRHEIRAGSRMNPDSKLLNKPKTEVEIDKPAEFVKDGAGKTKVDPYDPKDFSTDVKAKHDDLLTQREAAQTARGAHPEGSDPYKKHQVEVIKASEGLGNTSAEGVAKAKGFTDEPLNVSPEKGKFQEGKGTFDRVFKKGDKYLVAESKAGNSDLGTKEVDVKGSPEIHEQGTKEYFESTCRDMMGPTRSKAEQDLGAELLAASKAGKVEYILVQTPVNAANVLGTVKVKTFK